MQVFLRGRQSIKFLADGASDRQLVELSLRGQRDAFEVIMRRNNQQLFRIARGILKDEADAEDALQECYMNAYNHLSQLRDKSRLSAWLSRLVTNECFANLRRRRRSREVPLDEDNGQLPASNILHFSPKSAIGPEDDAARRELAGVLEAAIDQLPDSFRIVFVMREVEGMAVKEIGDVLGIPEATVKSRGWRARRALRRYLDERLEPLLKEAFLFGGARCARTVANVIRKLADADGAAD